MKLNFKDITIQDKQIYDKYLPLYKDFYGWEYSFAMTWIWNAFDQTQICDTGDMAFVRTKFYGKRVYYPPFLKDHAQLPKALEIIESECKQENVEFDLRGLLQCQIDLLDKNKYSFKTSDCTKDYIYNTQDLITLVGKRFHSKRNFVNRFKLTYPDFKFLTYDEKRDRKNIFDLFFKWQSSTEHETLALEEKIISSALDAYSALDLKIGVLYVGDQLAAFTVMDASNPYIAQTFFEKADKDFVGSYQAINQFAATKFLKDVLLVNRQEDLGIEGLKKAKESYYPVHLVEKFKVKLK